MLADQSSSDLPELEYGKKIGFESMRIMKFADFQLQFIGRKPGPLYPGSTSRRMGDIYEFSVVADNKNNTVTWSSGTGDIGPAVFEVQKKCFLLELGFSDRFGRLEDGHAVVSLDKSSPTACE